MTGEGRDAQQQPASRTSQRTREAAAEAARKRREGRQRPSDESQPDDAREDQPADTSEAPEEAPTPRPNFRRRVLAALPMIIAGIALIGYFVWLCLEMSSAAPFGGSALPAGIFGAVIVGGLAGVAGMKSAR